uniref:Hyccin n=1 Tax=Trichuris muris TaxID=70415 RepID=A0A5S6QYX6_TRIMR
MKEELISCFDDFKEKIQDANHKLEAIQHGERMVDLFQDFAAQPESEVAVVCGELLNFYHQGTACRELSLQLLPVLIECYLFCRARGQSERSVAVGTLLLTIYNCELQSTGEMAKGDVVRLVPATFPSIYNREPSAIVANEGLTEKELARLNLEGGVQCQTGSFAPASSLVTGNRFIILTYLIKVYNDHMQRYSNASVESFCRMCHRLCRSGYEFPSLEIIKIKLDTGRKSQQCCSLLEDCTSGPRIGLSPYFLCECLNGVVHALYNRCYQVALVTLESIHLRAKYELYPEVLLITNATLNTMDVYRAAGMRMDSIVGQRTILSPDLQHQHRHNPNVITRASFRLRKLSMDLLGRTKMGVDGAEVQGTCGDLRRHRLTEGVIQTPSNGVAQDEVDDDDHRCEQTVSKVPVSTD